MYCKDRQIVNIYIYKYIRTCIRKFRLHFFFVQYQKLIYVLVNLKYILI